MDDGTRPFVVIGSTSKLWTLDFSFSYPSIAHEVWDVTPVGMSTGIDWWQFDRLNRNYVGVNSNGAVYTGQSGGGVATAISTGVGGDFYTGIAVTAENFLVLIGRGTNGPMARWASQGTSNTCPAPPLRPAPSTSRAIRPLWLRGS
jgi:hypothetical protein